MSNEYSWWLKALAGDRGPISVDEPECGFFQGQYKNRKTGDTSTYAIAYWKDTRGGLICKRTQANNTQSNEGRPLADIVDDLRAREMWPYASRRPVTEEAYRAYCKTGMWPGESEAATADRRSVESARNSNEAPDPNSFEALQDRVDDLFREATKLIEVGAAKTQEQADCAADLSDRLRKLEKASNESFVTERKPCDEAIAAVRTKWFPLIERAETAKAQLKLKVVDPFLKALRDKNEAERVAAIKVGAAPIAPVKIRAGTTTTVAPRKTTTAVIEDYAKALTFFGDNAKVRDLIQQLANAAARAGACPDGCKINIDEKAA